MDYSELSQQHCPPAIIVQVDAIKRSATGADAAFTLFSQITGPDCRAAVLGQLLSGIGPRSTTLYVSMLLAEAGLRPWEIGDDMQDALRATLTELRVAPEWEADALRTFALFAIDRRDEFPLADPPESYVSPDFNRHPAWSRALYAAHFGDAVAKDRVALMMDHAGSASIVSSMLGEVARISPDNARPLIARFVNDPRRLGSSLAGRPGLSLDELAQAYLDALPPRRAAP